MSFTIEIIDAKSERKITTLDRVPKTGTVGDVKDRIAKLYSRYYKERQSIKLEQKGKSLGDNESLSQLGLAVECKLYFKDLGPQIGWTTVFLAEYAGPLFIFLLFYIRPQVIYGQDANKPREFVVDLACLCHTFHYAKRILETIFVHRFSHSTMPLTNLFKNCSYYWGFAAYIAYYVNHPLYTAPSTTTQIYSGFISFWLCEWGNFSIHMLLKNLRPAGSTERKIPLPNGNPFCMLFNFVSCPNYTYEVLAWLSFGIMTQCAPVLIFMTCGLIQMTIWAQQKHRRYKKEFSKYPRNRTSIIPFVI